MFIVFFVILLLTVFVTKWLEITREVQAVLSEVSDLLCFRWDAPWPSPPWTWQSVTLGRVSCCPSTPA